MTCHRICPEPSYRVGTRPARVSPLLRAARSTLSWRKRPDLRGIIGSMLPAHGGLTDNPRAIAPDAAPAPLTGQGRGCAANCFPFAAAGKGPRCFAVYGRSRRSGVNPSKTQTDVSPEAKTPLLFDPFEVAAPEIGIGHDEIRFGDRQSHTEAYFSSRSRCPWADAISVQPMALKSASLKAPIGSI
jgi:hypothetical protein